MSSAAVMTNSMDKSSESNYSSESNPMKIVQMNQQQQQQQHPQYANVTTASYAANHQPVTIQQQQQQQQQQPQQQHYYQASYSPQPSYHPIIMNSSELTSYPIASSIPYVPSLASTAPLRYRHSSIQTISVGSKVRLRPTDSIHHKLRDYALTEGEIVELPVHPNTWYGIKLIDGKQVKIRKSAFDLIGINQHHNYHPNQQQVFMDMNGGARFYQANPGNMQMQLVPINIASTNNQPNVFTAQPYQQQGNIMNQQALIASIQAQAQAQANMQYQQQMEQQSRNMQQSNIIDTSQQSSSAAAAGPATPNGNTQTTSPSILDLGSTVEIILCADTVSFPNLIGERGLLYEGPDESDMYRMILPNGAKIQLHRQAINLIQGRTTVNNNQSSPNTPINGNNTSNNVEPIHNNSSNPMSFNRALATVSTKNANSSPIDSSPRAALSIGSTVSILNGYGTGGTGVITGSLPGSESYLVKIGDENVVKTTDEIKLVSNQRVNGSNNDIKPILVSSSVPALCPTDLVGSEVEVLSGRFAGEVGRVTAGSNGYFTVKFNKIMSSLVDHENSIIKRSCDLKVRNTATTPVQASVVNSMSNKPILAISASLSSSSSSASMVKSYSNPSNPMYSDSSTDSDTLSSAESDDDSTSSSPRSNRHNDDNNNNTSHNNQQNYPNSGSRPRKRSHSNSNGFKAEALLDQRVIILNGRNQGDIGIVRRSGHGFYCIELMNTNGQEIMKRASEFELYLPGKVYNFDQIKEKQKTKRNKTEQYNNSNNSAPPQDSAALLLLDLLAPGENKHNSSNNYNGIKQEEIQVKTMQIDSPAATVNTIKSPLSSLTPISPTKSLSFPLIKKLPVSPICAVPATTASIVTSTASSSSPTSHSSMPIPARFGLGRSGLVTTNVIATTNIANA